MEKGVPDSENRGNDNPVISEKEKFIGRDEFQAKETERKLSEQSHNGFW